MTSNSAVLRFVNLFYDAERRTRTGDMIALKVESSSTKESTRRVCAKDLERTKRRDDDEDDDDDNDIPI